MDIHQLFNISYSREVCARVLLTRCRRGPAFGCVQSLCGMLAGVVLAGATCIANLAPCLCRLPAGPAPWPETYAAAMPSSRKRAPRRSRAAAMSCVGGVAAGDIEDLPARLLEGYQKHQAGYHEFTDEEVGPRVQPVRSRSACLSAHHPTQFPMILKIQTASCIFYGIFKLYYTRIRSICISFVPFVLHGLLCLALWVCWARQVMSIRDELLSWYGQNRRMLPWRGDPPPWTRWASCILA